VIAFNRSFDGGKTWDKERVIASKRLPFDLGIPAIFNRGALVYPACDSDRSSGPFRGRLYCSWMDQKTDGTTDIFLSYSSDQGITWSAPVPATDQLPFRVDRFNHWMSVDPVKGSVNLSFYDTRNDATGFRYETDVYLSLSTDGGQTFGSPNTLVTTARSNEHDCNGVFPCDAINYGNQYGDYEGLVSFNGISHAIWTDSRNNQAASSGCQRNLTMEEVFTAAVK
jgi:BNR/Asp-box repeat